MSEETDYPNLTFDEIQDGDILLLKNGYVQVYKNHQWENKDDSKFIVSGGNDWFPFKMSLVRHERMIQKIYRPLNNRAYYINRVNTEELNKNYKVFNYAPYKATTPMEVWKELYKETARWEGPRKAAIYANQHTWKEYSKITSL